MQRFVEDSKISKQEKLKEERIKDVILLQQHELDLHKRELQSKNVGLLVLGFKKESLIYYIVLRGEKRVLSKLA